MNTVNATKAIPIALADIPICSAIAMMTMKPTDPQKVAIAADDWGEQHKIKDPKSPIGNPKNFSPKQLNKLIDVLPQIVQDVEEDEEDSEESDSTINDSLYRRWSKLAGIIKG